MLVVNTHLVISIMPYIPNTTLILEMAFSYTILLQLCKGLPYSQRNLVRLRKWYASEENGTPVRTYKVDFVQLKIRVMYILLS